MTQCPETEVDIRHLHERLKTALAGKVDVVVVAQRGELDAALAVVDEVKLVTKHIDLLSMLETKN